MTQFLLFGLTAIVLLGVGAQWLAWKLRLPPILILIVVGVIAGPLTQALDPDAVFGEILSPLVGLAIAVILFEESLSFRFTDVDRAGSVVRSLAFVGTLTSWVLSSYLGVVLLDLPVPLALLLGAILSISGPNVISSLLRDLRLRGQLASIIRSEGIGIEPVGVTLAALILGGILSSEESGSAFMGLFGLLKTALIGGGLGTIGALALLGLLRSERVPDELEGPTVFATVITAYTVANHLQPASGLLAATIMGMILANQAAVRISPLLDLHENFRTISLSTLFVVLASRLKPEFFQEFNSTGFLYLILIVVLVRPAAVFLSTIHSALPMKDRLFLAAFAPRGFVAAGLSSLFALQLSDDGYLLADRLISLTFFIILGTVAIYGVAVPFVARSLRVVEDAPRGVLLLGAHDWARSIAREIQAAGIRVLAVDRNPYHVTAAQRENIPARTGNIFSGQMMEALSLEGFGTFIALTQNDEVNALASTHFSEYFGKEGVYQLRGEEMNFSTVRNRARLLFQNGVTYGEIERRVSHGAVIKSVVAPRNLSRADFEFEFGETALPMFQVAETGQFQVCPDDSSFLVEQGGRVIGLFDREVDDRTRGSHPLTVLPGAKEIH